MEIHKCDMGFDTSEEEFSMSMDRARRPRPSLLKEWEHKIICFSGIPGAGKSTLIGDLAHCIPCVSLYEEFDWECLQTFCQDPKRLAVVWQAMVIENTISRMKQAKKYWDNGHTVLIERDLADVMDFLNLMRDTNVLSEEDADNLYDMMSAPIVTFPHTRVILTVPIPVAMDRIRKRGRRGEDKYEFDYLNKLQKEVLCNDPLSRKWTFIRHEQYDRVVVSNEKEQDDFLIEETYNNFERAYFQALQH